MSIPIGDGDGVVAAESTTSNDAMTICSSAEDASGGGIVYNAGGTAVLGRSVDRVHQPRAFYRSTHAAAICLQLYIE